MDREAVKAVQRRLLKLGYNPGPIDGIRGRLTMGAVKLFQRDRGLVTDGIVGPQTMAALFPQGTEGRLETMDHTPWIEEAKRLLGLREDPRTGYSNPEVERLSDSVGIDYDSDDVPWCGLFTGHCIASTLPSEPLPSAVLWARAWLNFGYSVQPQYGAILVFWRGEPGGSKGHVGFYLREDEKTFEVLGGNQSNEVSKIRIKKKRLLDARWPATALQPSGRREHENLRGRVSNNEA